MSALNRVRLVLFFLSFPPHAAFTQQQAPPTPPSDQLPAASAPITEARDANLVLDVVVTDRSGKPRAGLTQNDFVVRDNNQIRKILSFRAVDSAAPAEPVKIILLVDEVNTTFTRVAYERDQLKKFLLQNGGQLTHPVSLAFFSDTGTEMQRGS